MALFSILMYTGKLKNNNIRLSSRLIRKAREIKQGKLVGKSYVEWMCLEEVLECGKRLVPGERAL